jgi:hypothetical protein
MGRWQVSLVLSVVLAIMASCCCPLAGLLGGAEFTAGDFSDVPAYPGSTQSTESNAAIGAMVGVFSMMGGEAEWKHYITTDSENDVLDWYEGELPGYGWTMASEDELEGVENGLLFWKDDDPSVMLAILALSAMDESGDTDIVVGRIDIAEE